MSDHASADGQPTVEEVGSGFMRGTPAPTPLSPTPVLTVGVVSSTSSELTHTCPQQTERTLRWLAALQSGKTKRTKTSVSTERAVPTPPAAQIVF